MFKRFTTKHLNTHLNHPHMHAANSCTHTAAAMQLNRVNVNITTSLSVAAQQNKEGLEVEDDNPNNVEPSATNAHRGSTKVLQDEATTSGETPSPDC